MTQISRPREKQETPACRYSVTRLPAWENFFFGHREIVSYPAPLCIVCNFVKIESRARKLSSRLIMRRLLPSDERAYIARSNFLSDPLATFDHCLFPLSRQRGKKNASAEEAEAPTRFRGICNANSHRGKSGRPRFYAAYFPSSPSLFVFMSFHA